MASIIFCNKDASYLHIYCIWAQFYSNATRDIEPSRGRKFKLINLIYSLRIENDSDDEAHRAAAPKVIL